MRDAVSFYGDVLGLKPALEAERLTVFPMGTTSLILFQLGMTEKDSRETSRETGEELVVAGHGPDKEIVDVLMADAEEGNGSGSGGDRGARLRTHYCLAVDTREEVRAWEGYLRGRDVKVRGVMEWKRGGRSVYFEDVDGHVGEIGSRGIWEHY